MDLENELNEEKEKIKKYIDVIKAETEEIIKKTGIKSKTFCRIEKKVKNTLEKIEKNKNIPESVENVISEIKNSIKKLKEKKIYIERLKLRLKGECKELLYEVEDILKKPATSTRRDEIKKLCLKIENLAESVNLEKEIVNSQKKEITNLVENIMSQIKSIVETQFLFKELNTLKELINNFIDELDKEFFAIEKLTNEMNELKKIIYNKN